ncbi:ABC transporter substrate-binding protein [Desulfobacterales bacterium HSG2]|nr:ABC transporter substrate-binding protein [Desulfobacterales bacterium HSG2]
MRKVCVKVMVCVAMATLLTGQGLAKDPLHPMTIRLNWATNVQFAGILLAKERGWYREAGIELTVRGWEKGVSPVDEVLAGKAQVGVTDASALVKSRIRGAGIKAVMTAFQKSPICLMSKKEQGIETVKQLVGKRIGMSNPKTEVAVRIMMKNQGLDYKDIIPVKSGWDLQPFIDGEFDVFFAFLNNEPLVMKKLGYEVNVIPGFNYGYDFYAGTCFMTERMIADQPDLSRRFVSVTLRGWREAFRDTEATAKLVVEKYYPRGTVEHQTESLKVFKYLATASVGESLVGFMEERIWEKGIDTLHKFGQIEKKIPATDVFTLEFLKK